MIVSITCKYNTLSIVFNICFFDRVLYRSSILMLPIKVGPRVAPVVFLVQLNRCSVNCSILFKCYGYILRPCMLGIVVVIPYFIYRNFCTIISVCESSYIIYVAVRINLFKVVSITG